MALADDDSHAAPAHFDTDDYEAFSELRDYIRELLTTGVHGNVLNRGTHNLNDDRHRGLQQVIRLYSSLEATLAARERETAAGEEDAEVEGRRQPRVRAQKAKLIAAEARSKELETENKNLQSQATSFRRQAEDLRRQAEELRERIQEVAQENNALKARRRIAGVKKAYWKKLARSLKQNLQDATQRNLSRGSGAFTDQVFSTDWDFAPSSRAASDISGPSSTEGEEEIVWQEGHVSVVHEYVAQLNRYLAPGDIVVLQKSNGFETHGVHAQFKELDASEGHHVIKVLFKAMVEGDCVCVMARENDIAADLKFGYPIPKPWTTYRKCVVEGQRMRQIAPYDEMLCTEKLVHLMLRQCDSLLCPW